MKPVVSFVNNGVIDPIAIRTFGVSAKENENPIGFFGTGLKYAIAICLRLGTKMVAGTLLEEQLHLQRKLSDCTRAMQNHLIDLMITIVEAHKKELV